MERQGRFSVYFFGNHATASYEEDVDGRYALHLAAEYRGVSPQLLSQLVRAYYFEAIARHIHPILRLYH